ncbi:hypothetical protein BEL04_07695 [Mucilaginibacter sp. PPCGB 2223]|uniref:hypothetical protein n=1 Tax=Mucilaginibacter sp. PPCGB 2223 TaxID=1886027 RepID=UPI0008254BA2|nr:hypothetical protein [Mucilaginibacter sp. PPCGB 2223]OCX54141.1 hypothetical protein BEL04_07695 [Mucilaginibacter sp. PPCGB 2223]
MTFEARVKKLVAEYLKISSKEILDIELINAVGYSGNLLNKVIALIEEKDAKGLEDEQLNSSDNPDTLSIYEIALLNQKYIALIFEPFELYENTQILKVAEMNNWQPATYNS